VMAWLPWLRKKREQIPRPVPMSRTVDEVFEAEVHQEAVVRQLVFEEGVSNGKWRSIIRFNNLFQGSVFLSGHRHIGLFYTSPSGPSTGAPRKIRRAALAIRGLISHRWVEFQLQYRLFERNWVVVSRTEADGGERAITNRRTTLCHAGSLEAVKIKV
jgi:hypothetical protein